MTSRFRPFSRLPLVVAAVASALVLSALPAQALELEDYAPYQPQTRCSPTAKQGTKMMGRWIVNHYGGGFGPIARPCTSGGTSEHKEGRAFDWTLDATKYADRQRAKRLMEKLFEAREDGEAHVLARRMGIMYLIWNDHIYSSYNQFERRDYLSSSCKTRRKCSKTLRHRDHMHISLTRKAARAETSFYVARLARTGG
ncbi:hypothetical protein EKO23_13565 [Nocardioides guangzhouensis]|uniref:ARB-07466-like C-terminal domain-containing protein n=1 Tax=Nocardioides guangzhouensis TaxID=2497878 RepID=A0A4Q4ZBR0_9ACTN|nr:hypothetical protein [Nocardioides guangzhouensis]RYP85015.1 hypothetical protein EKO23_13565 [Nocardioides guangzhouensis]